MRWTTILALIVGVTVPVATGFHGETCTPTSADPSTYIFIQIPPTPPVDPWGWNIYVYEHQAPSFGLGHTLPGSGFVFGNGTALYQETNELPGLQRGNFCGEGIQHNLGMRLCLFDPPWVWFPPGCDANPDWQPTDGTVLCMFDQMDSVRDETCGHGPDMSYII